MTRRNCFYSLAVGAIAFLTLVATKLFAQDCSQNLALNDAVEAALKNNKNIELAKLDQALATVNYQQTTAFFLPQADLSYTAMTTNNPLDAFGFKLQQRTVAQNDFHPNLLDHPSTTSDFMARLDIQKPLLNIDMLYMRKGAEKQTEAYEYKTMRTREYTTFEVKKAYLQLQLTYRAEGVLTEARKTATTVYTFTQDHFNQGLIQKSDLLNAQVHLAAVTSNLAKAKSDIRNASDNLSLLMGQGLGVIYKTDEESPPLWAGMDSTREILANRADFMAMQKAIEGRDMMIKSSEMSYLPKLNAFANYQYNDNDLTGFGARSYLVGVRLSWNVFNGNKTKHLIASEKIERDKLAVQLAQQKDQSQMELNKAYRELSDAHFEIEKEKAAIEQASEALRILQNRYHQGLVNTTEVLTADGQLSQLKFLLAQARFTADVTLAYIQLLTSTPTK